MAVLLDAMRAIARSCRLDFGRRSRLLAPLRRLWRVLAVGVVFACLPQPAHAAQCMQGKFQNVPQLKSADRGKTWDALVADDDVKAFQGYGLVLVPCRAELLTPSGQAAERDEVCQMTYSGNDAVQAIIRRAYGIHPGLLCQSAEKVAGLWKGEKIGWRDGVAPWLVDVK